MRLWVMVCGVCGMVLLGACVAPVTPGARATERAVVSEPTATLGVPSLVVATFTPVSEKPSGGGVPAVADAVLAQPGGSAAPEAVAMQPVTQYTVQAGDTLLGIALAHGVPMAAIQLQNDLGMATVVDLGQVLDIPPVVGWEGASPFWVVYEVRAGDALSHIAQGFGFEVAVLQGVNGLADADLLSVGQPLILPLDGPADVVAAANRTTAAAAPLPAATPVPTPAPPTATRVPNAPAPAATAIPTPVPAPPVPADVAAMPAEIFRLINEQRAIHGLGPLAWNGTLARAAQLHADDCYARGWCGHTGSDGSTMKARIIREGYDPVRWSECWAWYGTPEMAVAMWMDEVPPNDPHRRTILSTWLTEVGVGVVPGNSHGYYFIADFGTPR